MNDVERQLREIATGRGCGITSSVGSLEPQPELSKTGKQHPPKQHRTILVGGCEKLRAIFGQEPGVKEWWEPRKSGISGKGEFQLEHGRVDFPEEYKGQNFYFESEKLWHTWSRPNIDGDWERVPCVVQEAKDGGLGL